MNKFRSLLLTFLTVLCLSSCHNDELTQAPFIVNEYIGTMANKTSVVLEAKLDEVTLETAKHQWLINGNEVGNDYKYTFSPKSAGKYTITYIINNGVETFRKDFNITVRAYIGGFYIVNEGWFGHDNGNVNYFDPENQRITTNIYKLNNDKLDLGVTTCYGALWNGKYYFVSKQGRRLVTVDQMTFKDMGALEDLNGGDGRAFAGVDEKTGIVTTSNGAYVVSLNPLKMGAILEKTADSECGSVYATKNYVFVLGNGLLIYDIAANYKLVKEFPKGNAGFVLSKDGSLWAAEGNSLIKINTKTLEVNEIKLPDGVNVNVNSFAWTPSSLCASVVDNALFFAKCASWGGGNLIYKYNIADNSCAILNKKPNAKDAFYGCALNVDPSTGNILVTNVEAGYNDPYKKNNIVTIDPKTGDEIGRFVYDGYYWFPTMILFNNK